MPADQWFEASGLWDAVKKNLIYNMPEESQARITTHNALLRPHGAPEQAPPAAPRGWLERMRASLAASSGRG